MKETCQQVKSTHLFLSLGIAHSNCLEMNAQLKDLYVRWVPGMFQSLQKKLRDLLHRGTHFSAPTVKVETTRPAVAFTSAISYQKRLRDSL